MQCAFFFAMKYVGHNVIVINWLRWDNQVFFLVGSDGSFWLVHHSKKKPFLAYSQNKTCPHGPTMLVTRLKVFVNLHHYQIIVHRNINFIHNKYVPWHFKRMGWNNFLEWIRMNMVSSLFIPKSKKKKKNHLQT